MLQQSEIFEKTLQLYLTEIGQSDFRPHQARLGVICRGNRVMVPFFGKQYAVCPNGISLEAAAGKGTSPGFAASVALCKYLLMGRSSAVIPKDDAWASYKDFKDAAPLLNYFRNEVEAAISTAFSGRMADFESAVLKLGGGHVITDLAYDLKMRLAALPKVPVFLLFNDADGEFPAECRVLFERRAAQYLDMESLAIVGALTADYLKKAQNNEHGRAMDMTINRGRGEEKGT